MVPPRINLEATFTLGDTNHGSNTPPTDSRPVIFWAFVVVPSSRKIRVIGTIGMQTVRKLPLTSRLGVLRTLRTSIRHIGVLRTLRTSIRHIGVLRTLRTSIRNVGVLRVFRTSIRNVGMLRVIRIILGMLRVVAPPLGGRLFVPKVKRGRFRGHGHIFRALHTVLGGVFSVVESEVFEGRVVVLRVAVKLPLLLKHCKPLAAVLQFAFAVRLVKHVYIILQFLTVGLFKALLPGPKHEVLERVVPVVSVVRLDALQVLCPLERHHPVARPQEAIAVYNPRRAIQEITILLGVLWEGTKLVHIGVRVVDQAAAAEGDDDVVLAKHPDEIVSQLRVPLWRVPLHRHAVNRGLGVWPHLVAVNVTQAAGPAVVLHVVPLGGRKRAKVPGTVAIHR